MNIIINIIFFVLFIVSPLLSQTLDEGDNSSNGKEVDYEAKGLEVLPDVIIKPDSSSPNIIVVDKSRQKVYLYRYDGTMNRVKTFECTTGANRGNKEMYGDSKTPEGIYFFNKTREATDLVELYGSYVAKQYGIRAFDITFPNIFDRLMKRRGSGIWLHGTDRSDRIGVPYDTRGCVVVSNDNMEFLTSFIDLSLTPIIISRKVEFISAEKNQVEQNKIDDFLDKWKNSWQNNDMETYSGSYSQNFRNKGKNINQWIEYKSRVLKEYSMINISLSNISIYKSDEYLLVQFIQDFKTNNYADKGIKKLYLVEENGLKIVGEEWTNIELVKIDQFPGQ